MKNIEELIKESVLNKEWTVAQLTNIKESVNLITNEVYSILNTTQRFDLLREYRVKEDYVGLYFDEAIKPLATLSIL